MEKTVENVPVDWWQQACHDLTQADPKLGLLIFRMSDAALCPSKKPFETLLKAIIGQQISTNAANNIWQRFEKLCPQITPEALLRKHRKTLRSTGLSDRKVEYVLDLCRFFKEENLSLADFDAWEDQTVIDRLTTINGVGLWTAQMFLIFTLGRPDVLPTADLGFLKALANLYFPDVDFSAFSAAERRAEIEEITNKWRPWRTAATWYLWKSLNNGPIRY